MKYTAVIRTLGKAGPKYRQLLDSLMAQTIRPESVIVYLAEGYDTPKETAGIEQVVIVPKGMVAQRALPYNEVHTEYMLCLDDDVMLPANGVEKLYAEMTAFEADAIAPALFPNHLQPFTAKVRLTLFGKEVCRPWPSKWAYKVLRTGGFSYNNSPGNGVYRSQAFAGPCFLCRKKDFVGIRFADERWLDETPYALPDDQVMSYKMYCLGLRLLVSFDTGIEHLDAGTTTQIPDRIERLIYSEYRNKLIFWHRFFYSPANIVGKAWCLACISWAYGLQLLKGACKRALGHRGRNTLSCITQGIRDAISYINSPSYKALPKIPRL